MVNINKKIVFGILVMQILVSVVLVGCANQNTQNTTDAVSILFVGNSHVRTGNIPGQLQALARLHGIEVTYVDVSRNGTNLDSAMRDNAIREMQNGNFNYVVMQPSGRSIRASYDIDGFLNDIRLFSEHIRDSGATPVLYSFGWGRTNGQIDKELQHILSQAHEQAAYENDLILINAGETWLYAIGSIPEISLFSRDRIHANHAGAFLTASVFMATLFDLNIDNIPTGNAIDNVPMLNILTIVGLVVIALVITYRLVKKQPLRLKIPLVVIISLVLFQVMSFFPHEFIFTESGNRILLLYAIGFSLLGVAIFSVYRIIRIRFVEKQSWGIAKKYAIYILVCGIIYGLTFIPVLDLRSPLYRGDYAIALARAAWSFVNPF